MESFDAAGVDRRFFDLIPLLRQALGEFHTVFGVKQQGERTWWEFYFYDYRRRERERSLSRVLEAIRPLAPTILLPNENIFYFMFSIDITEEIFSRGIEEVHLYIGNPGSSVSSGICYSLTPARTKLENLYYFFDARTEIHETVSYTHLEGINSFRVEAALEGAPGVFRPGMEGISKINIRRGKLISIWTLKMREWFRLKMWAWLP